MDKKIVFLDMDGPLANFNKGIGRWPFEKDPPEMFQQGFFLNLAVVPGAKWAVNELLQIPQLSICIGSKHTVENVHCASEKIGWLWTHFPSLVKRTCLVFDKTLLKGDYLIDDDKKWEGFDGHFFHFDEHNPELSWTEIVNFLKGLYAH